MWPFRRNEDGAIPTFQVDNTIGTGTKLRGDVQGAGGFRIDGFVDGAIDAEGPVVIGEGGVVEGRVRGRDVVVLGCVRGDVEAAGHLEIGPKGTVEGDVTVKSFRMHTGGVFQGTSRMRGSAPVTELALAAKASPPALPAASIEPRRARTLPPPAGAVPPPPPSVGALGPLTPIDTLSHDRITASSVADLALEDDDDVVRTASSGPVAMTGTQR